MKRRLIVIQDIEFNHDTQSISKSMNCDFVRAEMLAKEALRLPKLSQSIEFLMFQNTYSFITKILAVYVAGYQKGQSRKTVINIDTGG